MDRNDLLPIGELARRTGLAVSAIRFYEDKGLIQAFRTTGNQRRFLRSDIRRLSFILIAQKLGLGLAEIEVELSKLPQGRTPTLGDWQRISRSMPSSMDTVGVQPIIRSIFSTEKSSELATAVLTAPPLALYSGVRSEPTMPATISNSRFRLVAVPVATLKDSPVTSLSIAIRLARATSATWM